MFIAAEGWMGPECPPADERTTQWTITHPEKWGRGHCHKLRHVWTLGLSGINGYPKDTHHVILLSEVPRGPKSVDTGNATVGARGWGVKGSVCNEDRASIRENKGLEMDGGGGGTTTSTRVYRMLPNCMLKDG